MAEGEEFDVIVIGFGGAGSAAAITAHDLGAKVLLLEKAEAGGGSTQASGGNIRSIREEAGAVRHFAAIADQGTPVEVVAAMVHGMIDIPDWLTSLGALFEDNRSDNHQALGVTQAGSVFEEAEGADALGQRLQIAHEKGVSGGEALWSLLEANVLKREITVQYSARADRLITDSDGRVVGVEVLDPSGRRRVGARGGVVLSCGGFNWAPEMHIDLFGTELYALTPPHRNEGDGIRMASEIGAQLWHMTGIAARYGYKFPEYEAAFKCTPPAQGVFMVDQLGRRYVDEAGVAIHSAGLCMLDRDPRTGQLLRCPSYLVFDENTRLAGPIGPQPNGHNRSYKWSADNSAEIERGWITKAASLEELAAKIGVPVETLLDTAARFNAASSAGTDEVGRSAEMMEPVVTPPFYAVPVWPVLLNTQGGPKRNADAQVIDARGNPIPGLYSAGELGSLWGKLYPGAGNVAEALVTGQIAARGAVSLVPSHAS